MALVVVQACSVFQRFLLRQFRKIPLRLGYKVAMSRVSYGSQEVIYWSGYSFDNAFTVAIWETWDHSTEVHGLQAFGA